MRCSLPSAAVLLERFGCVSVVCLCLVFLAVFVYSSVPYLLVTRVYSFALIRGTSCALLFHD
jgi:hypothetical protein